MLIHLKRLYRKSLKIFFYLHYFIPFSVNFSTEDTCLSLQCSKEDKKFIPKRCSEALDKVCEKISKFLRQYH